ncbi:MAG: transposase [Thermodesulfobacteriota bacterium]|nr:transposase [Thermodesulfobacteriota bacterium]
MSLKRTSHAVYEAKYHLVWFPTYRKKVLVKEIHPRVKELFLEIASQLVTKDLIRKYIEQHGFSQLQRTMFE